MFLGGLAWNAPRSAHWFLIPSGVAGARPAAASSRALAVNKQRKESRQTRKKQLAYVSVVTST